jgi:serine/threonine protein phosphatase PrpC
MNRSVQGREQFSGRSESVRVPAFGEEPGLEVAGLSHAGLVRRENQDALGYRVPNPATRRERGALFVVCDGVGTLSAGKDASDLAVGAFLEAYYTGPFGNPEQMLRRATAQANDELLRARSFYEGGARLGTTLVATSILGGQYYVLNVGDSRAYICRNGDLRQVSRDHSAAIGGRAGDRRISRALGTDPEVRADVFGPNLLASGDVLLLCSDGLTTSVSEPAIRRVVARSRPAEAATLLIERAKTAGAGDNITVLLVRIEGARQEATARSPDARSPQENSVRSFLHVLTWESVSPIRALSEGGWRTRRGLMIGVTWLLGALVIGILLGRLFVR